MHSTSKAHDLRDTLRLDPGEVLGLEQKVRE